MPASSTSVRVVFNARAVSITIDCNMSVVLKQICAGRVLILCTSFPALYDNNYRDLCPTKATAKRTIFTSFFVKNYVKRNKCWFFIACACSVVGEDICRRRQSASERSRARQRQEAVLCSALPPSAGGKRKIASIFSRECAPIAFLLARTLPRSAHSLFLPLVYKKDIFARPACRSKVPPAPRPTGRSERRREGTRGEEEEGEHEGEEEEGSDLRDTEAHTGGTEARGRACE